MTHLLKQLFRDEFTDGKHDHSPYWRSLLGPEATESLIVSAHADVALAAHLYPNRSRNGPQKRAAL